MLTQPQLRQTIEHGLVTIATSNTPEQLPDKKCLNGAIVSADPSNGITLYFGTNSGIGSANFGFALEPGATSPVLPLNNLNQLWVTATFTSETHNFTYVIF